MRSIKTKRTTSNAPEDLRALQEGLAEYGIPVRLPAGARRVRRIPRGIVPVRGEPASRTVVRIRDELG